MRAEDGAQGQRADDVLEDVVSPSKEVLRPPPPDTRPDGARATGGAIPKTHQGDDHDDHGDVGKEVGAGPQEGEEDHHLSAVQTLVLDMLDRETISGEVDAEVGQKLKTLVRTALGARAAASGRTFVGEEIFDGEGGGAASSPAGNRADSKDSAVPSLIGAASPGHSPAGGKRRKKPPRPTKKFAKFTTMTPDRVARRFDLELQDPYWEQFSPPCYRPGDEPLSEQVGHAHLVHGQRMRKYREGRELLFSPPQGFSPKTRRGRSNPLGATFSGRLLGTEDPRHHPAKVLDQKSSSSQRGPPGFSKWNPRDKRVETHQPYVPAPPLVRGRSSPGKSRSPKSRLQLMHLGVSESYQSGLDYQREDYQKIGAGGGGAKDPPQGKKRRCDAASDSTENSQQSLSVALKVLNVELEATERNRVKADQLHVQDIVRGVVRDVVVGAAAGVKRPKTASKDPKPAAGVKSAKPSSRKASKSRNSSPGVPQRRPSSRSPNAAPSPAHNASAVRGLPPRPRPPPPERPSSSTHRRSFQFAKTYLLNKSLQSVRNQLARDQTLFVPHLRDRLGYSGHPKHVEQTAKTAFALHVALEGMLKIRERAKRALAQDAVSGGAAAVLSGSSLSEGWPVTVLSGIYHVCVARVRGLRLNVQRLPVEISYESFAQLCRFLAGWLFQFQTEFVEEPRGWDVRDKLDRALKERAAYASKADVEKLPPRLVPGEKNSPKHWGLRKPEDVPRLSEFFYTHDSTVGIELLRQCLLSDDCADFLQRLEDTEDLLNSKVDPGLLQQQEKVKLKLKSILQLRSAVLVEAVALAAKTYYFGVTRQTSLEKSDDQTLREHIAGFKKFLASSTGVEGGLVAGEHQPEGPEALGRLLKGFQKFPMTNMFPAESARALEYLDRQTLSLMEKVGRIDLILISFLQFWKKVGMLVVWISQSL